MPFLDIAIEKVVDSIWDNIVLWRSISLILILEVTAILTRRDLLFQWLFQSRYREHDLGKFADSNKIMDEQVFMGYIETLYHAKTLYMSVNDRIDDWSSFVSRKENEYLTRSIRKKVDLLLHTILDIGSFTSKHFFTPTRGNPDRVSLYPDPKKTQEERARYEKYEKELDELVRKASCAYREYRGAVKNCLQV